MKLLLLAVGLAVFGCGVEVKRDSPQAVVGTLLKAYEAEDWDALIQVMDSRGDRIRARNDTCFMDTFMKDMACADEQTEALNAAMNNRLGLGAYRVSEECRGKSHFARCACDGEGQRAPAVKWANSHEHRALTERSLKAEQCKILDTAELNLWLEAAGQVPVSAGATARYLRRDLSAGAPRRPCQVQGNRTRLLDA